MLLVCSLRSQQLRHNIVFFWRGGRGRGGGLLVLNGQARMKKWLFLSKHKLKLMFSSIEPCAPRRRYLRGNLFPALRTTNTYSYHPLFIPANEKIACTCSQTASQSALHSLYMFTLNIPVDLHLQFSQAAGVERLFLFRTNFASKFSKATWTDEFKNLSSEILRWLAVLSKLCSK